LGASPITHREECQSARRDHDAAVYGVNQK
jgi:hypothetical protein